VSTGSVENVLQTARERAFQLGSGANKPEERTATAADSIALRAAEIKVQLDGYLEWLKTKAAGQFAEAAWSKFGEEYPTIVGAINGIADYFKNVKNAGEAAGAAAGAAEDSANSFKNSFVSASQAFGNIFLAQFTK
jgi:hypothetical protein